MHDVYNCHSNHPSSTTTATVQQQLQNAVARLAQGDMVNENNHQRRHMNVVGLLQVTASGALVLDRIFIFLLGGIPPSGEVQVLNDISSTLND